MTSSGPKWTETFKCYICGNISAIASISYSYCYEKHIEAEARAKQIRYFTAIQA